MTNGIEKLISEVMSKSESEDWKSARKEWVVYSMDYDPENPRSCVCGHENISYLYTIRNSFNGNVIFPVGSECVKKFNDADMDWIVAAHADYVKAQKVALIGGYIPLTERLIAFLFKQNVINSWEYSFLNNVFRKRVLSPKRFAIHCRINEKIRKAMLAEAKTRGGVQP